MWTKCICGVFEISLQSHWKVIVIEMLLYCYWDVIVLFIISLQCNVYSTGSILCCIVILTLTGGREYTQWGLHYLQLVITSHTGGNNMQTVKLPGEVVVKMFRSQNCCQAQPKLKRGWVDFILRKKHLIRNNLRQLSIISMAILGNYKENFDTVCKQS